MEIEKKFLLKYFPDNLENYEKKEIEQGYLCSKPTVRIRKSDKEYILTYKAKWGTENINVDAHVNQEMEMPLTEESYLHLRDKIDGNLIQKTRYLIPLPDGHVGEFDVFHGALDGLYFIEVEFRDEEDAKGFVPPDWFAENISGDYRYTNTYLSSCTDLSCFCK